MCWNPYKKSIAMMTLTYDPQSHKTTATIPKPQFIPNLRPKTHYTTALKKIKKQNTHRIPKMQRYTIAIQRNHQNATQQTDWQ